MTIVPIRENLGPALRHEDLGGRLRELRIERGLSLRAVSALTNEEVTAAGISRIELGQRAPTARTLSAIAGALGIVFTVDGEGIDIAVDNFAASG